MAKPDFSGEWTLNRQASTLSPGADGVKSAVWNIEHRDPTFRHKAAFVTATNPINYEYELQADAAEMASDDHGARTVSALRWAGDALEVTMRTVHPGGEMQIWFRYELIDGGRRLRALEELRGTDHDQDNTWIFDRS